MGMGTLNLGRWLHHADAAAFRLAREGPLDRSLPPHGQLSQLNVLTQLDHLRTYPVVREQADWGLLLELNGWRFDISTGEMHTWQEEQQRFVRIDRVFAEAQAIKPE